MLLRPPVMTIADVMKEMAELDEKIDDMGSGEYLRESNRLKSVYDRLNRRDYNAGFSWN